MESKRVRWRIQSFYEQLPVREKQYLKILVVYNITQENEFYVEIEVFRGFRNRYKGMKEGDGFN